MVYLPQEITETIVDHVGKYDDFLSRQELRNLRLVNKHFSQLATPLLFQTVPFWFGLSSLKHLTLISEHPQISHYVTKLVFSPLRFVKWEDPSFCWGAVRDRFERDMFSLSIFSLSFGEHVAAYKRYVEAQDYLSWDSQDAKILTRALRRLPRLKNVTVVFGSKIIGAREIMLAFGMLNGNEVTLDAEYTLSVLMEALSASDRELDTFSLVPDESPSSELFCPLRTMFNENHEPRFKYVSEYPTTVTAKALWNAFQGNNDGTRLRAIQLMSRLREFKMIRFNTACDDFFTLQQWSHSLEPIVAFASRLEELKIIPWVSRNVRDESGNVRAESQGLNLSHILRGSARFRCLRYVTLEHIESPESLLIALFAGCSRTLVDVTLLYVRVSSRGSWSEVFRELRNADFDVLCVFSLLHCGEAKGVVRAQNYLRRITNKNPIDESNEKQNDRSG